jgi:hypothetical protein
VYRVKLHNQYRNLEEFKAYCEVYNNHARLGFETPEQAWEVNPTIQGSTDPADYRVVPPRHRKEIPWPR